MDAIAYVPGLERVLSRTDVAREFDLPSGGGRRGGARGRAHRHRRREVDHDLSGLKAIGSAPTAASTRPTCRSSSAGVSDEYARRAEAARLHSYEAFDYAFNGIVG